jgi:hypothetical protein
MRIISQLNNIFDQYNLPENRVTNAFLHTLAQNVSLLKTFLSQHFGIRLNKQSQIVISAQKHPFSIGDVEEQPQEMESIPDGWIIIDEDKAIVFEAKIEEGKVRQNQLLSHVKQIRHFDDKYLCVITPDEVSPVKEIDISDTKVKWLSWRQAYELIVKCSDARSELARYFTLQAKEFMAMKNDIIGFSGINYSSEGYNALEAKAILKALLREIAPKVKEIFPKLQYEKRAVSERSHPYTVHHRSIWSCLSEEKDFTLGLHLTFWLHETHFGMGITIPNRASKYWKRLKKICKDEGAFGKFTDIIGDLRNKVPHLYIEFLQRHYRGMTDAIVDGIIEIDVDTIKGNNKQHVRGNALWYDVIRNLVRHKTHFNGQMMIRTRYFYKDFSESKTEKFKETALRGIADFKDIYNFLQNT